jgi:hypothetical protein
MRNPIPFDTHTYVKRLMAAGMPEAQAEALTEVVLPQLATKDDLRQALAGLEQRMDQRFVAVDQRFVSVDQRFAELETRLAQFESRLTVRMGAMLAAAIGLIATLNKLL